MRVSAFFLCTAALHITQLWSDTPSPPYGTGNKMCCIATITSRQIRTGLGNTGWGIPVTTVSNSLQKFDKWDPSFLFAQNDPLETDSDDSQFEKMDQFPKDSLFAPGGMPFERNNYAVWTNTFSEWSRQASLGGQPPFHYHICGLGAGVNYFGFESCAIGGGLLYDHIRLKQDQGLGEQWVNYALGTFYGSFPIRRFSINLAATGGFLFTNATRSAAPSVTAFSSYPGYQIMPHMDMNYDFSVQNVSFSPFYQLDWVLTIESASHETGAGDLNIGLSSIMASLVRQEIGMNFFQKWDLQEKGVFIFREKGSYVRIDVTENSPTAQLVGAGPVILVVPSGWQNFGSGALEMRYQSKLSDFILTFEGFYGDGFINNAGYFTYSQGF